MRTIKRVKPILQMEATECGAASLAMILRYYGKTVPIEQLRRECGVSRNGVNAKNMILAARLHGLDATAIKTEPDAIEDKELPAIIHWNMDHFVVLCGITPSGGAVIADPESGLRTVTSEELSRSFTGIALLMTPTDKFKKNKSETIKSRYVYSRVLELIPSCIYFMIAELCILIFNIALMFLNSAFIDKVIIDKNTANLANIIMAIIISGGICATAAAARENLIWNVGRVLSSKINTDFINKILKLPIDFFSGRTSGDLTNRHTASLEMGDMISASFFPIPGYILQILIYIVILFLQNSTIALTAAIFGIVNVIALTVFSGVYSQKTLVYSRDMGALESDVSRTIDLIDTIKSFGAEKAVLDKLIARGTSVLNSRADLDRIIINFNNIFKLINNLCAGLILIFGVREIISGSLSVGILVTTQSIAAAMLVPMDNAMRAGLSSHAIMGDMERTDDIMKCGTDNMFAASGAEASDDFDGDIELKDVGFCYNTFDAPVLSDIDIVIKKGSFTAVTGGSGSGKTTLINIIAGICAETSGTVTYNGLPRACIDRDKFYQKTAVVSQKTRLFSGTVHENITMWDDSISYDDVVAAAKLACIHDYIVSRPRGYRELVSENGRNFSGGQQQLIEIARAIVKKPALLILDEATASLDAATEARVIENIKSLGITVFVVAHRLSTIIDSDEIIVLDKGRVAERGSHKALIDLGGIYYELLRSVG